MTPHRNITRQFCSSFLQTFYLIPKNPVQLRMSIQGPKVLINSLPKSGTNLLLRCISLFPGMIDRRFHFDSSNSEGCLERCIERIKRGQFASAHLWWDQDTLKLLHSYDIKCIFIIRDLRDIVVSAVNYLMSINTEHVYSKYLHSLADDHTRLMVRIVGSEIIQANARIPGIAEQTSQFAPWLQEESICCVRFEELVGAPGYGSSDTQIATVKRIVEYLGFNLSGEQIIAIAQKTFWRGSQTFRKGQIGDWQNYFSNEHKAVFKEQAGQFLIDLGYEKDFDW